MGKEIFIFEPLCLFYLRLKEGKIKSVCLPCVFEVSLGKSFGGLLSEPHVHLVRKPGGGVASLFSSYMGTRKMLLYPDQACGGTQDSAVLRTSS